MAWCCELVDVSGASAQAWASEGLCQHGVALHAHIVPVTQWHQNSKCVPQIQLMHWLEKLASGTTPGAAASAVNAMLPAASSRLLSGSSAHERHQSCSVSDMAGARCRRPGAVTGAAASQAGFGGARSCFCCSRCSAQGAAHILAPLQALAVMQHNASLGKAKARKGV